VSTIVVVVVVVVIVVIIIVVVIANFVEFHYCPSSLHICPHPLVDVLQLLETWYHVPF
jgi:hypothetical protein